MTQQRNHRIHSGHGTNTGRITHEDRKRGRFYTRRRWQQAAAALVFILAALFLYRTGQLYLERKALSREAQQWHRVQAGNTPAEPNGGVEYQGKSYRRNTYIKAILCMGIDRPGSLEETMTAGFGGQADGIFLVAQDTARDRIKVLVIPRDTMTEITLTDLSGNELGSSIQHLTLAYAYGDGREKSCRYMTEAVSRLLGGLSIDGYMAVSMSVLPLANDKVGGVTVTIEEPELKTVNPAFVQGQTVTLRGGQAEEYVRYRDTGRAQSALVRMERQKTYIKGFLDAARNKSRLDDSLIPDLMKEIEPYMVTDMTKDRYLDMTLDFLGGNQDFTETDMVTLPGTAVETVIYDEYHPDQEEIMEIVLDWFYRPRE